MATLVLDELGTTSMVVGAGLLVLVAVTSFLNQKRSPETTDVTLLDDTGYAPEGLSQEPPGREPSHITTEPHL